MRYPHVLATHASRVLAARACSEFICSSSPLNYVNDYRAMNITWCKSIQLCSIILHHRDWISSIGRTTYCPSHHTLFSSLTFWWTEPTHRPIFVCNSHHIPFRNVPERSKTISTKGSLLQIHQVQWYTLQRKTFCIQSLVLLIYITMFSRSPVIYRIKWHQITKHVWSSSE